MQEEPNSTNRWIFNARLPAHNPYVGSVGHGSTTFMPPLQTYSYLALHSPHLPFMRHSAPTAPIAKLIHDIMIAEQCKREQCGEDDWVFVEKESGENTSSPEKGGR